LIGSIASADFTASGTAYSKALAAQEKWTEDAANDFVSMPNSFACIISNSGGDVNANALGQH
jgi:cytochrome c2